MDSPNRRVRVALVLRFGFYESTFVCREAETYGQHFRGREEDGNHVFGVLHVLRLADEV